MNTAVAERTGTKTQARASTSVGAVATLQPSRLPLAPSLAKEFEIEASDWRVLVDQIFPAAKSAESVLMALAYCRKRNLDIFKKPVHIVPMYSSAKRRMVETVWPGIAEIRTTASRTGEYAGIDAVEFGPIVEREFSGEREKYENGNPVGTEKFSKKVRFPEWASVVVYRMVQGVRCPYHAKVFWEETYATVGKSDVPNEMWAKRPRGQLDKCVEAAALRKAFPEELGNTYAAEEMEGRTIDHDDIERVAAPTPPSPPSPPPAPKVIEAKANTTEKVENKPTDPDIGIPEFLDRTKDTPAHDAKTGEIIEPDQAETDTPAGLPPCPGTGQPEAFLEWVDDVLGTVTEESGGIDALETLFNSVIDPHREHLFPPDQGEVDAIYERHQKRFEP